MDRRTLVVVILLALTLFVVNMYFEQQHQADLKVWNEKRLAFESAKIGKLDEEINAHTVSLEELPLVDIFADAEGKDFLVSGLHFGESLLTLSWNENIPKKVFARPMGSRDQLEPYQLTFMPEENDQPVLFQKGDIKPLTVGNLSDIGTFYLQMITPGISREHPVNIRVGKYTDGSFTIPELQIKKLQQELNKEAAGPALAQNNAIALVKDDKGFLPVAFYDARQQRWSYLDEFPGLSAILSKSVEQSIPSATQKAPEQFYVLESPYQQLVFSNYGGALAEINLPFSNGNKSSVVKEIEFDRDMVAKHPYNAHFPAHPYYTPTDKAEFQEHAQGQLGGYYPLIRRDLFYPHFRQVHVPPRFYALNIVSEYPELAELVYTVKHFDKNSITFEAVQSHRRITKTYTIASRDSQVVPYVIELTIKIEGDSRGLWLTSGIPEVEWISGSSAPALKFRTTRGKSATVESIDLPQDSVTVSSIYPDWIADSNGFLGLILDPTSKNDPGYRVQFVAGTLVPSRLVEIGSEKELFKASDMPGYMVMLPLKSTGGTMTFRIYAGPFADDTLKHVDALYSDSSTGYNPDYIASQTFHGWFSFISEPFAKFLLILMKFFHQLTGSWGFSIILLTVALRIMMYPLNAWSNKSMMRMQQIAPEVAAIQEKHKKDPKKAQLEIMTLYREKGVNPMSGCLPMLMQMPFLIGMFDLLKSNFELRGASFIPGWIDDLASPDVIFSWETPIFFIGNQLHLLPIILGIVMFIQQRLMSPLPSDAKQLTDQQRQQRAMGTIMSVFFAIMFYNFPSGLNIYWLSSMLLGILQQWWTMRKMSQVKNLPEQKKAIK